MVIVYMTLVVCLYILLLENVVQDCSFKEFFITQIIYEMA